MAHRGYDIDTFEPLTERQGRVLRAAVGAVNQPRGGLAYSVEVREDRLFKGIGEGGWASRAPQRAANGASADHRDVEHRRYLVALYPEYPRRE
jgi:hypothetical protein